MAHGKNAEKYSKGGADYWKKRGLFKRCKMWMASVSCNSRVNKKTKRLTHKSERQQEREYLHQEARHSGAEDSYYV
jgi:hypothetical protein